MMLVQASSTVHSHMTEIWHRL